MSDSNLQTDYQDMLTRVGGKLGPLTTTGDLVAVMRDELFPFIASLVGEIGEIDGAMQDLVNDAEDILQPETAAVFAALIKGTRELVTHFKGRVDKTAEPNIWNGLITVERLSNEAEQLLEAVTVMVDDDDGDDDDDDEDDDDDDEDDDEDDTSKKGTP